jgi:uncharacterized protein YndB with AHSA1/START domain
MIIAIVLAALLASPVTLTRSDQPVKSLKFEVIVPGTVDQVWDAFTTADGLASWLWRDVRVDARPGGDWPPSFRRAPAAARSCR